MKDRVILVSDLDTARQLPAPSYLIMLKNEHGGYEPMRNGDGVLVRFRPDWGTSATRAKLIKEKEKRQQKIEDEVSALRDRNQRRLAELSKPSPQQRRRATMRKMGERFDENDDAIIAGR